MTRGGCTRERDVLRAVARDWASAASMDLVAHLDTCARCRMVRDAGERLRAAHDRDTHAARVPTASAMWWRLDRRAAAERARRAQRLAFALQALVVAAALGAAAAAVQVAAPWLHGPAATTASAWRATWTSMASWAAVPAGWTLPLAALLAAWLLIVPTALYFVLVDE